MWYIITGLMELEVPNPLARVTQISLMPFWSMSCFVSLIKAIKLLFFDPVPQNLGLLSSSLYANFQCNINESQGHKSLQRSNLYSHGIMDIRLGWLLSLIFHLVWKELGLFSWRRRDPESPLDLPAHISRFEMEGRLHQLSEVKKRMTSVADCSN